MGTGICSFSVLGIGILMSFITGNWAILMSFITGNGDFYVFHHWEWGKNDCMDWNFKIFC